VGHHAVVKKHLKALLTSELTAISEMSHNDCTQYASVDEEGIVMSFLIFWIVSPIIHLILLLIDSVRCNVGDWVEVLWDYSPGNCSEGGTGVVIALTAGMLTMTILCTLMFYTLLYNRRCNSEIHLWPGEC
jgi:hypothetical protein